MNKKQAKAIDDALHGPRLFCGYCRENKVLSPCSCCLSKGDRLHEQYCRGCSYFVFGCAEKCDVCNISKKRALLLKINEIMAKDEVVADLADFNLKELPKEIGQLTQIKQLRLGLNRLVKLPKEIGLLAQLQDITLYSNPLKELPKEIGQLTQLQYLDLSDSQLKKIPKEIGQLTQLKGLSLRGSQLEELPAEIGQLTQLKSLDLSYNQLRELPEEIKQLTQLEKLYVYGNRIKRPQRPELREALPNCEFEERFQAPNWNV